MSIFFTSYKPVDSTIFCVIKTIDRNIVTPRHGEACLIIN